MINRIIIDTNVLLDYLLTREPFYEDAKNIISICVDGKTKGCIAAHSISNMFYILRKNYGAKINLVAGLQNEDFSDFEDCLQMECAKTCGAEYIVTRNVNDYKASEVRAILPKDYLELLK